MSKLIPLSNGGNAIVDDDMYDFLMQWKWRSSSRNGKSYAARIGGVKNKRKNIFMHSLIMESKSGYQVDHCSGDSLDNRRSNLRYATIAQNCQNRPSTHNRKGRTSQYKGVSRKSDLVLRPWQAEIEAFGKRRYLGIFATETEAAKAYDDAARMYHGEFAHLNFPDCNGKGTFISAPIDVDFVAIGPEV